MHDGKPARLDVLTFAVTKDRWGKSDLKFVNVRKGQKERECMHATVVKERPQLRCTYLGWHDFSATGSKQVFSTARSAKPRSQLKHVWKEMSNYSVIKGRADVWLYLFTEEGGRHWAVINYRRWGDVTSWCFHLSRSACKFLVGDWKLIIIQ